MSNPSQEWIAAHNRLDAMLLDMPQPIRDGMIRSAKLRAMWADMLANHFPIFAPAKVREVIEEHLAIKPAARAPWRNRDIGLRRWDDTWLSDSRPDVHRLAFLLAFFASFGAVLCFLSSPMVAIDWVLAVFNSVAAVFWLFVAFGSVWDSWRP